MRARGLTNISEEKSSKVSSKLDFETNTNTSFTTNASMAPLAGFGDDHVGNDEENAFTSLRDAKEPDRVQSDLTECPITILYHR